MKCMIGVLVIASLCLAEPEADPLHYYAPYSYPYFYRPYYASGYAGPLPGASYQSVHRLHKREAEADPQFLAAAAPYVNDGPVAGPLTAAFGDLVATERGLRPISLEGFSEDVNQDGFVDPVAQAVPFVPAPAPVFTSPVVRTLPAPVAPFAPATFAAPAFTAPLAVANPVVQAPVVKSVVETPATVAHVAAPLVHHLPLAAPAASVVGLTHHDCVTPHGCAVRAALLAGTPSATFGHVTSTRIAKREAEPTAEASPDAEADADAFYYGFGHHYGYNAYHGLGYNAYAPYTAGYGYSAYAHPFGYNYFNNYLPYAAPVAAPVAPVVKAAPAPLVAAPVVKSVTKPVTYTHIGAHPVAPTTVLETEHFF